REEYEIGLTCYAMPLRLPGSDFAGAISISGPSARMRNPDSKEHFLNLLKDATQEALQMISPYDFIQNTTGVATSSTSSPS
ncbi:MAG TPA: IclR family transcriptional regulator C-terminal domain-containing protein, partial [Rectinemataceae bacterium]|nr:IclR family transcriptional regulator C-terminal domain-containing protein [Rectinemataceae bacterium]